MAREKISEVFHRVDPGLTVISGGARRRGRKKKAKTLIEVQQPAPEPYKGTPLSKEDWDKAQGANCPICGKETQQLIPYGYLGLRKACKECIEKRVKLLDRRAAILGDKETAERRRKILECKARIFARRR